MLSGRNIVYTLVATVQKSKCEETRMQTQKGRGKLSGWFSTSASSPQKPQPCVRSWLPVICCRREDIMVFNTVKIHLFPAKQSSEETIWRRTQTAQP